MEKQKISTKYLIVGVLIVAVVAVTGYLGSNEYLRGDINDLPKPDLAISDIYLDSSNKLTVVQSNLVHENAASADVTAINGHTYIYIYKNSDGSLFKKWTYSWSTLSAVKSHPSYFLKAGETMNIQPMKLDSKDYTIQACIDPKNVVTNEYEESGSFDCATGSSMNNFKKVNLNSIIGSQTVIFKDKNLENIIRSILYVWNKPITVDDMLKLKELTYVYPSFTNAIKDLTGLEYAINLTTLSLTSNQISDISALTGLINLEYLDLAGNQISDLIALSRLTNLTNLYLDYNKISSTNGLNGLVNLEMLCVSDNQISDISALSGLINLTYLSLNDNQISDISALSGLINLTYLSLNDNQISDISALSGLTNLISLYLYNNQISDISALSGLINLTYLSLNDNQVSEITSLINNSGIDSKDEVILNDNFLEETDCGDIQILEDRGVYIYTDVTC
jgi:Leucine-rich repeat (LRR) protein